MSRADSLAGSDQAIQDHVLKGEATDSEMLAGDNESKRWVSVRRLFKALSLFAFRDSPVFTGDPRAPTPARFDSSKSLVTTEFAKRSGMEWGSFSSVSASTTLTNGSVGSIINVGAAAPATITLPPTTPIASGGMIKVVSGGGGAVTVSGSGAEICTNLSGSAINLVLGQGDSAILARLTGEWRLVGGSVALKYANIMSQPIGTTQPLFDASLKFATTDFVKKSSGNHAAIGGLSANVVLTAANTFGMCYLLNSVASFTVTLPLGSTGPNGGVVNFINVSTGAVTIKLPATNYLAGMGGVGDGGSFVLKQNDSITLSTAGGTAWYAEDGSVRDAQSTAIKALIGNYSDIKILSAATALTVDDTGLLCIAATAMAGLDVTLPKLSTTVSGQTINITAGNGAFNLKVFAGDPGVSIGLSALTTIPIDVFESIILVASTSGWRVVSGTVLNKYSGMFSSSLGSSGYQKLPSGLQECRGTFTSSATPGAPVSVTFPFGFGSISQIVITPSSTSTTAVSAWHDSASNSGFNGRCNVASTVCHYIAKGQAA